MVKGAWASPASLEVHPHALAPAASLSVREVVSAAHKIVDLTLHHAEVAYDYLAPAHSTGRVVAKAGRA